MHAASRTRTSTRALLFALAAAAVLVVAAASADAQCAMCRAALESSAEGRALIAKLNVGILLLLAAPFGIAALVALAMARSQRRLRAPKEAA
jgi:hypothetical protein